MSKISLEPNDSGAGTFTLAAPNSNTNRTLTLPDEAGKLLSTGNDDPAEVFKQSNILGTVSESGGVPTGAIIEQDSNANGEFVKYADGTQIVYRTVSGGWASSTRQTIDYAATFITRPTVNATYRKFRTADPNRFTTVSIEGTSSCDIHISGTAASDSFDRVYVCAIGRWY